MVLRFACDLDITLKLIFVTFFTLWTLSFSDLRFYEDLNFMKVYRHWAPCKHNSLLNFNPFFMQLCTSFFHGLKICMWFGFNPAVNLYHFSTLLTSSFFSFSQVRHQLHRSSIYFILVLSQLTLIFRHFLMLLKKCLKISMSCESTNIKNSKRNRSGFYSWTLGHFSYIVRYTKWLNCL